MKVSAAAVPAVHGAERHVGREAVRRWTEKLYMMKPERVMHLDGSRVEDNEVGLTRINQ